MLWTAIIILVVAATLIWFSIPGDVRSGFLSNVDTKKMLGDRQSCITLKMNDEAGVTYQIGMPWLECTYSEEGKTYAFNTPPEEDIDPAKKLPIVVYCHGRGGQDMDAAEDESTWRERGSENNFVVAFPNDPTTFWEDDKTTQGDLDYLVDMLDDLNYRNGGKEGEVRELVKSRKAGETFAPSGQGTLDLSRIYFVGFDSGGVFANKVALAFGGILFAAVCNKMGGKGTPSDKMLDSLENGTKCPMLIVTGSEDDYRESCEDTAEWFKARGYDVQVQVLPGQVHDYSQAAEGLIYDFFKEQSL